MLSLPSPCVRALALACLVTPPVAQTPGPSSPPRVLLTADLEGTVDPCNVCPGERGRGGLARLGTLVRELRGAGERPVLVDAGNALFGIDSIESGGAVVVDAFTALGYDAVNLSWRDFRLGRDVTLARVEEAPFPLVSANLRHESGAALTRPYVVVQRGGTRVALLGVTEAPGALEHIPHLREQLAGVTIEDPLRALGRELPMARAEADVVLLLYYGGVEALNAILAAHAGDLDAVLVGGLRPTHLPAGAPVPLVASEGQGRTLAVWAPGAPVEQRPIGSALAEDPRVADVLLARRPGARPRPRTEPAPPEPEDEITTVTLVSAEPPPAAPLEVVPTAAQPERMPELEPVAPAPERLERVPSPRAAPSVDPAALADALRRGRRALAEALVAEDELGEHLLAALALARAGALDEVPELGPRLRAALDAFDLRGALRRADGTRRVALLALTLDALDDPRWSPLQREAARYLVEAQGADGTWPYRADVVLANPRPRATGRVLHVAGGLPKGVEPGGEALERTLPTDAFRGGDPADAGWALLGLHAARRSGFRAPDETWRRAAEGLVARQLADGGWSPRAGLEADAATTALAAAGLVACDAALGRAPLERPELLGAAVHLEHALASGAVDPRAVLATAAAVEQLGGLIGVRDGAELVAAELVRRQREDGRWRGASGLGEDRPLVATAHAVLALARATPPLVAPGPRGGQGELAVELVAPPPRRLYAILDASESMQLPMGGSARGGGATRFDLARTALADLARSMPADCELALRVHGHRRRSREPGSEHDTALELHFEPANRVQFLGRLTLLRPLGRTPLAESLARTSEDLLSLNGAPVTVVAVVDGGDDTHHDAAAAARGLGALPGVTLHVIGLDVKDRGWREELLAVGDAGRGFYVDAADELALRAALRTAALAEVDPPQVVRSDGRVVARPKWGARLRLSEGRYRLTASFAGRAIDEPFSIGTDATTRVALDVTRAWPRPEAQRPEPAPDPAAELLRSLAAAPRPRGRPHRPSEPLAHWCTPCARELTEPLAACDRCGALTR